MLLYRCSSKHLLSANRPINRRNGHVPQTHVIYDCDLGRDLPNRHSRQCAKCCGRCCKLVELIGILGCCVERLDHQRRSSRAPWWCSSRDWFADRAVSQHVGLQCSRVVRDQRHQQGQGVPFRAFPGPDGHIHEYGCGLSGGLRSLSGSAGHLQAPASGNEHRRLLPFAGRTSCSAGDRGTSAASDGNGSSSASAGD